MFIFQGSQNCLVRNYETNPEKVVLFMTTGLSLECVSKNGQYI